METAGAADLRVSARTGAGMEALRDRLAEVTRRLINQDGPPALTRPRHRAALASALANLERARAAALPELRGEDLRRALYDLGRITGHVGTEEVLDAVFSQFCIGK